VKRWSDDDLIKIKREGVRDVAMHANPDMAGSQFCQAHVDESKCSNDNALQIKECY
jgi:hypothetical protein